MNVLRGGAWQQPEEQAVPMPWGFGGMGGVPERIRVALEAQGLEAVEVGEDQYEVREKAPRAA